MEKNYFLLKKCWTLPQTLGLVSLLVVNATSFLFSMESRFWWDCLGRGAWCGVSTPSGHIIKNLTSSPSSCLIILAPGLMMGLCAHLPHHLSGVCCLVAAITIAASSCAHLFYCVWKPVFLKLLTMRSLFLCPFVLIFVRIPKTWSEMWMSDLRLSTLQSFIFCMLATWWSLCGLLLTARSSFSDEGWEMLWFMSIAAIIRSHFDSVSI